MSQNTRLPLIKVSDIQVGDFIDLEGDPHADPNNDIDILAMELPRVDAIDIRSDGRVCVFFDDEDVSSVIFPSEYTVRINRAAPLLARDTNDPEDEGA